MFGASKSLHMVNDTLWDFKWGNFWYRCSLILEIEIPNESPVSVRLLWLVQQNHFVWGSIEVRGDSKFKAGDGKRSLDVRGEGAKAWTLKNSIIVQNAISLFPVYCHFQILNNTQTWHLWQIFTKLFYITIRSYFHSRLFSTWRIFSHETKKKLS